MFWFILGAIGFGALCALGSGRRNYDQREFVNEYDYEPGDCGGCDDRD